MSYTLTQDEFVSLRRRLRTAQNRVTRARRAYSDTLPGRRTQQDRDAIVLLCSRVIELAEEAEEVFNAKGFPDSWADWPRAADDAHHLRYRARNGLI